VCVGALVAARCARRARVHGVLRAACQLAV
jgi:hypothetical protein